MFLSSPGRHRLRTHIPQLVLAASLAVAFILPLGQQPLPVQAGVSTAPTFAHVAFLNTWERTDAPVASQATQRTWFWGPQPNSGSMQEDYKEGVGGKRIVQYFDKSRMEINDPNGDPSDPFFVTNGLLTVELISGQMQVGKTSFVSRQPANINVTGDNGDTLAPTYADLAPVSSAGHDMRDPDRTGQPATATLARGGKKGNDPSRASVPGVQIAYYEPATGHNIPEVMWDFLNSSGPVNVAGHLTEARLTEPWFYASGLPVSDSYWVRATIQGKPTDVLLQAYERRVLTYVPGNPDGFKVEMGNIGQHYYQWRYGSNPTPVPSPAEAPGLSRFAVDTVGNSDPGVLDKIKQAGAGAIRVYISWPGIEPNSTTPDKFNWGPTDTLLKAAADRGLAPVALVLDCPAWACENSAGPIATDHLNDFAQFMAALAARYGKAPYDVHYWELYNEPDAVTGAGGAFNWGKHGDRYASMLKAVRPAVKAVDPSGQIVMGGVAYDNFTDNGGPFNRKFVDDVLDAGGGQYLDAFNFHYYVQNINWCSLTDKLNELRAKLDARTLKLPILSTETGYTSDPEFGSNDDTQSMYVAQTYAQISGEGMLSTAWFEVKDFTTTTKGWKVFAMSGLLDLQNNPKPSFTAYQTAVSLIGQRPAVRALGKSDGMTGKIRGYEFAPSAGHNNRMWVVWAWDLSTNATRCGTAPAPADFALPAAQSAKVLRVVDIYGRPVATHDDGNYTVFSLDARPVYIEMSR